MKEQTTDVAAESRVSFGSLESWLRGKIQRHIQDVLEEEVAELLGRRKSERRQPVDSPVGYRNGYGKPRKLTLSCGTVTVRRPRLRGLEERFESRILPLFARRTREVSDLLPELYLHGLAQGDFELALRGLLGEGAPLSGSTVARLTQKWQAEFDEWSRRRLERLEVVYLWADGIYVKAGLEKEKAAVLVVLAALSDGRKEIVAIASGYRESTESWSAVLRGLRERGMEVPRLVIADGHLSIWGALRNVFPEVDEQRCWNHRILNVLSCLPKRDQAQARMLLQRIPYASSAKQAARFKAKFQEWCGKRAHEKAAELIDRDWDRMITFYRYPKEHWHHLRTTNPVESPFAALRLRTDAAKRFKKVANARAVIWKMLLVAEKKFRRLNAPALMREVYEGVQFVDGLRARRRAGRQAA